MRRITGFRLAAAAGFLVAPQLPSEIVDRVAAVVGNEAVTLSEIETQLRLEAMLNRVEFQGLGGRARDALRRLIDRRLVLQDLAQTPFLMARPDEVERQIGQLREEAFLDGRDYPSALLHYGLTEGDCRSFLEESIAFERYVTFRFKTGLEAEPAAIDAYYKDEYAPRQRERGEPVAPAEAVTGAIARLIVERRANDLLEERLMELRSLVRIETKLPAAAGAAP